MGSYINTALIKSRELTSTIAEQQSHQVREPGCNAKFDGLNGEHGKSAALWLADMERHREKGSSPSLHLRNIDRQLEGEADRWAKNTPSARIAILKAYGEEATESDVEALYQAITQRFQLVNQDVVAIMNSRPLTRLLYLKQEATEDLTQYYSRAMGILIDLHGRDGNISALTPLEMSVHGFVVERFVTGLAHQPLCTRLLLQNVLHPTRTLFEVYKLAVTEARIMASEKESEQEDGKEKEEEQDSREKGQQQQQQQQQQERKHKLDNTELENPASAKKQIVTLKVVPTATQEDDKARPKSNPGGESTHSGNDPEGGNIVAVPHKRPRAPPKSKPTIRKNLIATPKSSWSVEPNPSERRYPRRRRGPRTPFDDSDTDST